LIIERPWVVNWVIWHRIQGFDRAILYVNQPDGYEEMSQRFSDLIMNGSLSIVDWGWPNAWPYHDEPAQQMSCIYRARGRIKWLGLNDIDEFFVARNGTITVRDYLIEHDFAAEDYAGLVACNRWTSGPDQTVSNIMDLNKWERKCDAYPGSQKAILNPINVDYYYIHYTLIGKPDYRPPLGEFVSAHYGRSWRGPGDWIRMNVMPRYYDDWNDWMVGLGGKRNFNRGSSNAPSKDAGSEEKPSQKHSHDQSPHGGVPHHWRKIRRYVVHHKPLKKPNRPMVRSSQQSGHAHVNSSRQDVNASRHRRER
jgi:hypothetical protein